MANSKDHSYRALHENVCRLPNFCVQQHAEKGVGEINNALLIDKLTAWLL